MKYRKKPVIIEAIQVRAWDIDRVADWCKGIVIRNDNKHALGINIGMKCVEIKEVRRSDNVDADIGDWIIKNEKGEFYPCKPDIFEQTYEPVEEK